MVSAKGLLLKLNSCIIIFLQLLLLISLYYCSKKLKHFFKLKLITVGIVNFFYCISSISEMKQNKNKIMMSCKKNLKY